MYVRSVARHGYYGTLSRSTACLSSFMCLDHQLLTVQSKTKQKKCFKFWNRLVLFGRGPLSLLKQICFIHFQARRLRLLTTLFVFGRCNCEITVQQHKVYDYCSEANGQEWLLPAPSTKDNHQLRSSQVQGFLGHISIGFLPETIYSPRRSQRRYLEARETQSGESSSCSLHSWTFGLWTQMSPPVVN